VVLPVFLTMSELFYSDFMHFSGSYGAPGEKPARSHGAPGEKPTCPRSSLAQRTHKKSPDAAQ